MPENSSIHLCLQSSECNMCNSNLDRTPGLEEWYIMWSLASYPYTPNPKVSVLIYNMTLSLILIIICACSKGWCCPRSHKYQDPGIMTSDT